MENYNPLLTENKWQSIFERKKLFVTKNNKKKSFIVLKCFLILLEISTWGM